MSGTHFEFNLRFPGQTFDSETGLYHNGFRDYDPNRGRYIQPDPIGLQGGLNLYAYAESDPVNGYDPLGLSGILTIHATGNGGVSGHSWVSYTPDGGPTSSYGTWGNNPSGLGNGLHSNIEIQRNMVAPVTRMTYLSDQEETKFYSEIYKTVFQNEDAWKWHAPCSIFSSNIWNKVTGENLSPYGPYSNPSSLMTSIIETNGGVQNGILY